MIALLVALQAASIAYVLMSVGHPVFSEGQTLDQNTEVGGAGVALHAVLGMQPFPALGWLHGLVAFIIVVPAGRHGGRAGHGQDRHPGDFGSARLTAVTAW